MKKRCFNPSTPGYKNYGGRGITVCDRWMDFKNFFADMGECPPGMSIERINNNGNYEPGNCKWATRAEQNKNTRANKYYTINGVTKHQAEWLKNVGINSSIFASRIKRGWDVEKALTTPRVDFKEYYTINGVTKHQAEWLREAGIDTGTFGNRIKNGWSIEEALTKERIDRSVNYTINGVTKSQTEWLKEIGINVAPFRHRLKQGWTLEEALTTPKGCRPEGKPGKCDITFNGVTKHRDEWLKEIGLNRRSFLDRLERGWTLEQALTTPKGHKPS